MFPKFSRDWVQRHHVWRARHSQPVVEPGYARLIPPNETPIGNVLISSMAQIYPEDRGTNYAVREGRRVGRLMAELLGSDAPLHADPSPETESDAASPPADSARRRRAAGDDVRWEASWPK